MSQRDSTPIDLTSFIKSNQPVISVLGVFIALTVFSSQLGQGILPRLLSASCLAVAFLVGLLLIGRTKDHVSGAVVLFKVLLGLIMFQVLLYWLWIVGTAPEMAGAVTIIAILALLDGYFSVNERLSHAVVRYFKLGNGRAVVMRVVIGVVLLYCGVLASQLLWVEVRTLGRLVDSWIQPERTMGKETRYYELPDTLAAKSRARPK